MEFLMIERQFLNDMKAEFYEHYILSGNPLEKQILDLIGECSILCDQKIVLQVLISGTPNLIEEKSEEFSKLTDALIMVNKESTEKLRGLGLLINNYFV